MNPIDNQKWMQYINIAVKHFSTAVYKAMDKLPF